MPIAPVGVYSTPLGALARAVAASTTFQSILPVPLNAAAHVYQPMIEEKKIRQALPFAVVGWGDRYVATSYAAGGQNYVRPSEITLRLVLADIDRYATNETDPDRAGSMLLFGNWIGGILIDLQNVAGASGELNIVGYRQEMAPAACSEEEEANGLYWMASFLIDVK